MDKVLAEAAWWPEARFLIATAAGLWTGQPTEPTVPGHTPG